MLRFNTLMFIVASLIFSTQNVYSQMYSCEIVKIKGGGQEIEIATFEHRIKKDQYGSKESERKMKLIRLGVDFHLLNTYDEDFFTAYLNVSKNGKNLATTSYSDDNPKHKEFSISVYVQDKYELSCNCILN